MKLNFVLIMGFGMSLFMNCLHILIQVWIMNPKRFFKIGLGLNFSYFFIDIIKKNCYRITK